MNTQESSTPASFAASIILSLILITIFFFVFSSLPVLAESGHGSMPAVEFLTFLINFCIFAGIIYFLLRKKIPAAWTSRAEHIADEVTKNERALIAAQKDLDAATAELAAAPQTIAAISTSIEKEQRDECSRIAADAKEVSSLATKRSAEIAEQESRAANSKFEEALAAEVLKTATSKLSSNWNEAKDQKFCALEVISEKTLSSLSQKTVRIKEAA